MRGQWWILCLVAVVACRSGAGDGSSSVPDPAAQFASLEARLLAAQRVLLDYRVSATGAVEAELEGSLELAGGVVRLTGKGHFAGQPAELTLEGDGAELVFGNSAGLATAAQPVHLEEALLIGLTRMGILHNLARLTGGAPPDHAAGGVQEWVIADSFRTDSAPPNIISFELVVSEEPSGTASLEISDSGVPVQRLQTVAFPNGEMQVVESYMNVRITPAD